jgi:MFS family permease
VSSERPLLSGAFLRVTVANFFFFLNFASFFLLPLEVKQMGGNEGTVGAVMGTGGVATLLALPAIGLLIDRAGRRLFLLVGATLMAVASALYLRIDQIGPPLFALRVLQGVSFAMAFTATTTFAAELAPRDRRAQALGVFGVSTLLTHAIAPGIGEELVNRAGFHALFATATVCTLVCLGLALGLPRDRGAARHHDVDKQWRLDRPQWLLGVIMALSGLGFGAVITFFPTFVLAEALGRVGFFYFSYTLTAILTRVVGAGISDSYGRRAVIMPTLLALAASVLLLSAVGGTLSLLLTGGLFGVAQGINYPTLHAYLIDITPEAHLGRAQALFNGAFNFGVTSSAFVFGAAAHQFGHRPMFVIAGVMPLAALLLMYLIPEMGRHGQRVVTAPTS